MRLQTSYTKAAKEPFLRPRCHLRGNIASSSLVAPSVSSVFSARERGTVVLVALCFVAVLGLMLASYLAVSSRAMQLSNRSFQSELSRQLAEAGIEEALRAFNKNDWSNWSSNGMNVNWALDTTNNRATATINYPSNKFSQGTTATTKVRVDNYNSPILGSTWTSKTYQPEETVRHSDGVWYICIKATNQSPPNLNNWVPVGVPWKWDALITYNTEDLVYENGYWYRCNTNLITGASNYPPTSSRWDRIAGIYSSVPWPVPSNSYFDNGSSWGQSSDPWNDVAPISWRWRGSSYTYKVGHILKYNNVWYRCIAQHTSSTSYWPNNRPGADTTLWRPVSDQWAWTSSTSYLTGDVVFRSNAWYRCIKPHSNQQPPDTRYWSDSPISSDKWVTNRTYDANSVIRYNGVWYRNTTNTTASPPNSPWISADTPTWNSTSNYNQNDYASYGGIWYRCVAANTNRSPNDQQYWTPVNASVIYSDATVTLGDRTNTKTQLRGLAILAPLFPNAIAATDRIIISSSGGTVDSYDSTKGSYDEQKNNEFNNNYQAVISASGTSNPAIQVGNTTTLRGYAAATPSSTSPYAPITSFSSGTTLKGATSPGTINIDPSRLSRSPYVPIFDPLSISPTNSITLANNTSYTLGIPGSTIPIVYDISSTSTTGLVLNSTSEIITIVGPVILAIAGDLQISSGKIIIASTGEATIYFGGRLNITYASGAGIENRTSSPSKLSLISSSSLTTHRYQSYAYPFYGTMYLPYGRLSISNSPQIYGSVTASRVTFSNAANVHYDTSLRYGTFSSVDQPYSVANLRELPAGEQATMP